jgi:hypothetical protein
MKLALDSLHESTLDEKTHVFFVMLVFLYFPNKEKVELFVTDLTEHVELLVSDHVEEGVMLLIERFLSLKDDELWVLANNFQSDNHALDEVALETILKFYQEWVN